jgi:adenylate kinase family enzyme
MKFRLGHRILIFGPTGSGKSTIGRRIAEGLGLPFLDLDAIHWLPNWTPKPQERFQADVRATLDRHPDGWVVADNYTNSLQGLVLAQADTVLWLRLPFRVTFWRLLCRIVRRAWTREVLWGTNTESWRLSFLSRDSILLWAISNRKRHVEHIQLVLKETPHHARVYELHSQREVRGLLASPLTQQPLPGM